MSMTQRTSRLWWLIFAACPLFATGVPMPWNSGLSAISTNVTGPTALGLVTIGAAGTLGPMVFHGEIPQWAHRGAYLALLVEDCSPSPRLLAIPTLVTFFGIGGALI